MRSQMKIVHEFHGSRPGKSTLKSCRLFQNKLPKFRCLEMFKAPCQFPLLSLASLLAAALSGLPFPPPFNFCILKFTRKYPTVRIIIKIPFPVCAVYSRCRLCCPRFLTFGSVSLKLLNFCNEVYFFGVGWEREGRNSIWLQPPFIPALTKVLLVFHLRCGG